MPETGFEPPNLGTRVALLERMAEDLGKLVSDHEQRLRRNERLLLYGVGVVGAGSFILNFWARLQH